MTKTIYILTLVLFVACQSQEKQQQERLEYEYVVKSYYSNPEDSKNLHTIKFYDSSDRLLREIGREGDCIRYIYDETGKLKEKVWGRSCEQVHGAVRSILIYDSLDNHVGTYTTHDSLVNLDTLDYKQTYFYDSKNRLIKEKTAERVEPSGDTVETWNYYTYDGNRRDSVVIMENDGLLWKGAYKYDKSGKLVELRKTRRNIFENEYFIYDNHGRLIEKLTEVNDKVASPIGVVKVPDSKIVYMYDSAGFLSKEILYHDGKAVVQEVNIKEYKN